MIWNKAGLENFAESNGKQMWWSLFILRLQVFSLQLCYNTFPMVAVFMRTFKKIQNCSSVEHQCELSNGAVSWHVYCNGKENMNNKTLDTKRWSCIHPIYFFHIYSTDRLGILKYLAAASPIYWTAPPSGIFFFNF